MKTVPLLENKATLLGAIRNVGRGLYNRTEQFATAKLAGYKAASPTTTTTVGSRIGTNPNYSTARIAQVGMYFTGESVAKNDPVAAMYLQTRRNYCRPKMFIPNTSDSVLNTDITDYLKERWKSGGINCSMFVAFGRTANVELPVRGDAGLMMIRDGGYIKWGEFSADQVGEPFYYVAPRVTSLSYASNGDLIEVAGSDLRYYAGVYYKAGTGTNVAYKIYERQNSWYGNPQIVPASDVIFFRDDLFRGIRGITKFANALQYMEKGDTLFQSGMDAALRQARTAIIVKNARGEAEDGTYQDIQMPNGTVSRVENRSAQGSTTDYYYSESEADFMAPVAPGNEVIDGCEFSQELVAGALGFTYAFLFNGGKISGAPSRLDTNKNTKEINRINEDVLLEPLERISYIEIMNAVSQGIFPAQANITRGHWPFVPSPTSDQFRESQMDIDEVRAGLNSEIRVISKDGATPQQIIQEKAQFAFEKYAALDVLNKRMKDAGINHVATIDDIASTSDNPQDAAAAGQLEQGKPADGKDVTDATAKLTALLAEWNESDHPRNDSGEFGEAARQASEKSLKEGERGSPILHKEAADAHQKAADSYKDKITSAKSNPKLNDTEKAQLIKHYKSQVKHHQLSQELHNKLSATTNETWGMIERNEARMSAYIGDFKVSSLPESTQGDIAKVLGTNGSTGDLSVTKYGMTVPELLNKADQHNMQTARFNIRNNPNYQASNDVHGDNEKHILLMNDRIVDGHHFLAKAEKGKVSKSLPVIDLTPTRFQTAMMSEFDESKHPRAKDGEFGAGSGSAKKNDDSTAVKQTSQPDACDERCKRARMAHVMVDKSIQRYAEEHNEPATAKALGGVSFPNGEPIDIAIAGEDGVVKHGIELKTVVKNSNAKITMKGDAIARKRAWERKNKAVIHTVVLDDTDVMNAKGEGQHDLSKRKIYYRRGYGSFRIGNMHQVKDMNELKTLLDTPTRKLPQAAK